MKKQITYIAVNKSSFILAICFTIGFLVAGIVQLPRALSAPGDPAGRVSTLLLLPLGFGVGCYLFGLVFFYTYNQIAKRFGGIEVALDDDDKT